MQIVAQIGPLSVFGVKTMTRCVKVPLVVFTLIALAALTGQAGPFSGHIISAEVFQQQTAEQEMGYGYGRPARAQRGSRSEVIAPHGMVAASQPLAAQAGQEMIKTSGKRCLHKHSGFKVMSFSGPNED